jgi:hypothetical protein
VVIHVSNLRVLVLAALLAVSSGCSTTESPQLEASVEEPGRVIVVIVAAKESYNFRTGTLSLIGPGESKKVLQLIGRPKSTATALVDDRLKPPFLAEVPVAYDVPAYVEAGVYEALEELLTSPYGQGRVSRVRVTLQPPQ